MIWLYYIILLLVLLSGVFLNVLTLPGLWLMVAGVGLYGWATGWNNLIGWPSLGTLFGLAVLAEIIEFLAGAAGAKSAGGSKRGAAGSIIGGIIGAIFLSFLVPIPIVGTVVGICLGAFAGAAVVEWMIGKDLKQSALIGAGAAKGRFYGIIIKIAFGVVMLLIGLWAAFPMFK